MTKQQDNGKQGLPKSRHSFSASIRGLENSIDHLPKGWHAPLCSLLLRLKAVKAPVRKALGFQVSTDEYDLLTFQMSRDDPVVCGVLRKAMARCATTCQQCGKHGGPRQIGFKRLALCAACYAPMALKAEVRKVLDVLTHVDQRTPKVFSEADWSPRLVAVVPAEQWRRTRLLAEQGYLRYVTLEDAARMVPWLQRLRQQLERLAA